MTSRSPDQNFELLEPISVDVLEQETTNYNVVNRDSGRSNNVPDDDDFMPSSFVVHHPLELSPNDFPSDQIVLSSPHSVELDGFQSVSAPASLEAAGIGDRDNFILEDLPTAGQDRLLAADLSLGTSIVIIPPQEVSRFGTESFQTDFNLKTFESMEYVSSRDAAILYSVGGDTRRQTSSRGISPTNVRENEPLANNMASRPPPTTTRLRSVDADANLNDAALSPDADSSLADRLKLFWNNARYQIKVSTAGLSESQPICLLGKIYGARQVSSDDVSSYGVKSRAKSTKQLLSRSHFDKFKADFRSRIWVTYRKNFSPLPNSELMSDLGWGCMIRSGQMMIAQAFVVHRLGRQWTYGVAGVEDATMKAHRQIIRWFGDSADKRMCPLSIHNLTELSQQFLSKRPGDWFGPSSIAVVLRKALTEAAKNDAEIGKLALYVATDCTVFLGDIKDLASQHEGVIVFVPVRLGMDTFNMAYEDSLKAFLSCKYSLGIIGGKPRHSLYFVGYQGSNLIYLDPHLCQPTTDVENNSFDVRSYHCDCPQKTSFSAIDPTLALGFLFNSSELMEFQDALNRILRKSQNVFVLSEGSLADHQLQCSLLDDICTAPPVDHLDLTNYTPVMNGRRTTADQNKQSQTNSSNNSYALPSTVLENNHHRHPSQHHQNRHQHSNSQERQPHIDRPAYMISNGDYNRSTNHNINQPNRHPAATSTLTGGASSAAAHYHNHEVDGFVKIQTS